MKKKSAPDTQDQSCYRCSCATEEPKAKKAIPPQSRASTKDQVRQIHRAKLASTETPIEPTQTPEQNAIVANSGVKKDKFKTEARVANPPTEQQSTVSTLDNQTMLKGPRKGQTKVLQEFPLKAVCTSLLIASLEEFKRRPHDSTTKSNSASIFATIGHLVPQFRSARQGAVGAST